jgi:hypothetical protein
MVGTENVGHDWLDIPGKVLLSERLGRHVELDVEAGSDQLIGQATVRVPGVDHPIVVQTPAEQRSRPGDDVAISAPAERIYLFDKTTGDRLR